MIPELLLGNVDTSVHLGKVSELSEDESSRHHLDSTDPAKSPPQGVWLTSPSQRREENKIKIASGCIWAAVGPETDKRNTTLLNY